MNKEEKLKDYHQKLFIQFFLSGICYLLNVFHNPVSKPASCQVEKFPANSEKNLLNLASKQLKWQHWHGSGWIHSRVARHLLRKKAKPCLKKSQTG